MKTPVPKTLLNRINIIAYWEDYQLNEALGSNHYSFQKQFEGVWSGGSSGVWSGDSSGGSGATPGRLCNFYPHLNRISSI